MNQFTVASALVDGSLHIAFGTAIISLDQRGGFASSVWLKDNADTPEVRLLRRNNYPKEIRHAVQTFVAANGPTSFLPRMRLRLHDHVANFLNSISYRKEIENA